MDRLAWARRARPVVSRRSQKERLLSPITCLLVPTTKLSFSFANFFLARFLWCFGLFPLIYQKFFIYNTIFTYTKSNNLVITRTRRLRGQQQKGGGGQKLAIEYFFIFILQTFGPREGGQQNIKDDNRQRIGVVERGLSSWEKGEYITTN